jgi:hypothetical protein
MKNSNIGVITSDAIIALSTGKSQRNRRLRKLSEVIPLGINVFLRGNQ